MKFQKVLILYLLRKWGFAKSSKTNVFGKNVIFTEREILEYVVFIILVKM